MLKYSFIFLLSYLLTKCLCADQILDGKLITAKTFMFWPNASVPFYINPDHFDHEQAMAIMTSLSMFAFKTCIKFAPVMTSPKENQHVMTFINPDGLRRCRIHTAGHKNYHPHLIELGYECLRSPEIDMIIMRALGLPFEHNRMSRDIYIDVMIENIEPSYIELYTKDRVLPPALRLLPYDINSVMHFGERDYSKNGHRTIIFKNHNVRQNRAGLSATDIRKIELIYGPECRNRDRQEKFELCQSYPGVARRKREIEPSAHKSLRVNRDITPPPAVLSPSTVEIKTEEKVEPLEDDIVETDDTESITDRLHTLGIMNETHEILEHIYKVSVAALKNARGKYCNQTANITENLEFYNEKSDRKHTNQSDIVGIIEVIAEYAKSMVGNAIKNLTMFCQNFDSLEMYQRQCKLGLDSDCPRTFRSTNSEADEHSTEHRPIIKPIKQEDGINKAENDKNKKEGESTTPSLHRRRKREATITIETPKPEDEIKEEKLIEEKKILKEKSEAQKENMTAKEFFLYSNVASKSKENNKDLPRRFFMERRYKVKDPKEVASTDWEESSVSVEVDNASEKETQVQNGEDTEKRDRQRDEEDQRERDSELKDDKLTRKEDLFKDVINEGLDSLLHAREKEISEQTTEESKESKEEDSEKEVIKEPVKEKEVSNERNDVGTAGSSGSENEKDSEKVVVKKEETTDTETSEERKPHKKKIDKVVTLSQIESTTKEIKESKSKYGSMKKRKRSHTDIPKTVKLNQFNREFYDERKWPDGVIRYVIKKIPGFDLEDLRNRLKAVNSILMKKTCVKLKEVAAKEAPGYDDYLILDTSPDYVTGRVGGKQIFGCVELFEGGQHKQHTAMMVMAMLGFYFEVSRHDRDQHIRVHMRHVRPDKLHHFEKIRDEATLNLPYDYKSATHPAWQFWRKIGKIGISTVATFKEQDPDGSVMRALGQNPELLSEYDIIKINSVYGIDCFQNKSSLDKEKRLPSEQEELVEIIQ